MIGHPTIAVAFLLSKPGVIAIPKSSDIKHMREIAARRDAELDAEDYAFLDRESPAPKHKTVLDIV